MDRCEPDAVSRVVCAGGVGYCGVAVMTYVGYAMLFISVFSCGLSIVANMCGHSEDAYRFEVRGMLLLIAGILMLHGGALK